MNHENQEWDGVERRASRQHPSPWEIIEPGRKRVPDSPHFLSPGALRGGDASADGGGRQAENLTPALSGD